MLFDRKLLGQVHFRSIQLIESERPAIHPQLVQLRQDEGTAKRHPQAILSWLPKVCVDRADFVKLRQIGMPEVKTPAAPRLRSR